MADPATPTDIARRLSDLEEAEHGDSRAWQVDVVSESFTTGSEDVASAFARLATCADEHDWNLVVGLTELPLRGEDGSYLVSQVDPQGTSAVVSLPALGGLRTQARARRAVREMVVDMANSGHDDPARQYSCAGGRGRVLVGMVLANRPWRLVPGLKSGLVAALATGAIATINSTVWLLADSLSWWRLVVATIVSIALLVGWLIVDGGLWDRPEDDSKETLERSRLYNTSTVITLTAGVLICYLTLYVVNLAWALFILDPDVTGSYLNLPLGYSDIFVLAWFVASAATVGGGLGSGLESNETIRAAVYSKREEERRQHLAEPGN